MESGSGCVLGNDTDLYVLLMQDVACQPTFQLWSISNDVISIDGSRLQRWLGPPLSSNALLSAYQAKVRALLCVENSTVVKLRVWWRGDQMTVGLIIA